MKNNRLNTIWRIIESKTVDFSIPIEFVTKLYDSFSNDRYRTDNALYSTVASLYYYIDKDEQYVQNFLDNLSQRGRVIIEYFLNKYGLYVNTSELRRRLLENISDESFELVYPIPVYVSASPDDRMTIGLYYHEDGRIEMFEGNDEATEQTVKKVNRALGGKNIRIYGSHNQDVVNQIVATGVLPPNMYVSPEQSYAAGYYGADRVMFSGIVDSAFLNQESEYDWKTMEETPIQKVRLL
jgi:hypothetical protein